MADSLRSHGLQYARLIFVKSPNQLHFCDLTHVLSLSFFFWPHHMACRILVLWLKIEPGPWQWKCWVLTSGCCYSVTQLCLTLCNLMDFNLPIPQASLPSLGVCPSSCSLHRWCRPAISSSDALFSFCPQSFPASETFPIVSRLFATGDQNTEALTSASVLFTVTIVDPFIIALLHCLNKPHDIFIHYSLYQTFACFTFGLL